MALLRPWLKAELKSILSSGGYGRMPPHRSCPSGKKHVQCIEVDEEHNALRINDSETVLWCFVSTPGMKHVSQAANALLIAADTSSSWPS